MGVLRVDHPDIGRFAVAKRREGALSHFNLSVAITDPFLEALRANETYVFHNPRTDEPFQVADQTAHFYSTAYEDASRDRVDRNFWRDFAAEIPEAERYRGRTDLEIGEPMLLPARFIWDVIVDGAWRNGEPGLLMVERVIVRTIRERFGSLEAFCGRVAVEESAPCPQCGVRLSRSERTSDTPCPECGYAEHPHPNRADEVSG